MPNRVKFHLDENVSNAIADGLKRRGIDVTTTAEVNLISASDEEQIEFALTHYGITYCRQRSRSIGEIINTLALIWEWVEPEDIKGKVEFI